VRRLERGAPGVGPSPIHAGANDPTYEEEADDGSNDDAGNGATRQDSCLGSDHGARDDSSGGLAGEDDAGGGLYGGCSRFDETLDEKVVEALGQGGERRHARLWWLMYIRDYWAGRQSRRR